MRGLTIEPDISYTDFAKALDIDPSYLRKVLKRLEISGHGDPAHRSRKLLTPEQQRKVRAALKRNNTGTTPEQNTGTTPEQNTGTTPEQSVGTPGIYSGELMVYEPEALPIDPVLALQRRNAAEAIEASQMMEAQMSRLEHNVAVLCGGIEAAIQRQVSNAVANGIASGLNAANTQTLNLGKPQPAGAGGG